MRDLPDARAPRPFGWFVHHQGRGHALRTAALVDALPPERPVTIFCARTDIFPPMRPGVELRPVPSLFEPPADAAPGAAALPTPETLHCAPVGWPSIRRAMGAMAAWWAEADPALMICDVSAEVAQAARICSVPTIVVLQHGDRGDPGHRAAYDGAAGMLAPFHADLAQDDWAPWADRTHFAPGLGCDGAMPDRDAARARLGIEGSRKLALVISGGGGDGVTSAPLGVAARALPGWDWVSIGAVRGDWHATEGPNLRHMGWVEDAPDWIAAADLVVASTGNTTCQQVLGAARPWIAVPEWRYFDEQVLKARALDAAGAALHLPALPSSAHRWQEAVARALAIHDPTGQRALVGRDAEAGAALWLEDTAAALWGASEETHA
jgi:hypothetical protein